MKNGQKKDHFQNSGMARQDINEKRAKKAGFSAAK